MVLILMNLLFVVSRKKRWGRLDIFRVAANMLIGLGLALSALIACNPNDANNLKDTPWILPLFCLVFFLVVGLNSLPGSVPFTLGCCSVGARRRHQKAQPARRDPIIISPRVQSPAKPGKATPVVQATKIQNPA